VPYAWRLENLFVVNAGTVSSRRLRGKTRPCYNVIEIAENHVDVWRKYPFHGEERIIQFSTETLAFEKYTTRIESEVTSRTWRARELVVVAMGRGGPPDPELAQVQPTLERLLELSRAGRHAASDYLETAALAGVVTIGCRRAGGGLAGAPGQSNVLEGAALAAEQEPDLVLFDGSGAAIPPIDVDARVLVTSSAQPVEVVTGYLNAYRI